MKGYVLCVASIFSALLLAGCNGKGDEPIEPVEPVVYEPNENGWAGDDSPGLNRTFIILYVKDADGNNLFDPDFEGNILDNYIYTKWLGPTEEGMGSYLQVYSTRMIGPVYFDIMIFSHGQYEDNPALIVVDFDMWRMQPFSGEQLYVDWGDGTRSDLKFDCYYEWAWAEGSDPFSPPSKSNPTVPVVTKNLWIDGELVSDDSLTGTIVK